MLYSIFLLKNLHISKIILNFAPVFAAIYCQILRTILKIVHFAITACSQKTKQKPITEHLNTKQIR